MFVAGLNQTECSIFQELTLLCHRGNGRSSGNFNLGRAITVGGLLGAVARDVTSFAALVAGLARRVQRATVRRRAVSGDVTKLSAGVALHGLSLAVAREVVRTTALVACGRSGATGETASAEATTISTAGYLCAASCSSAGRVGASSGQVTGLSTVIAATVTASTAQAEGRAISLDVSEALAMVALLRLRGTGEGTLVGFVRTWLFAVVAEALGGRADLGIVANVATLVACSAG
ncbi:hypothetical protein F4804DRAFT_192339 [Jackrogersella minutella]|nr:hypothetical protein F4804DRAFT_192339 [Jackrogersella minutella]